MKIKSGFLGERAVILPIPVVEEMKKDALCSHLFITDIGFYPHAIHHYRRRCRAEVNQYIFIYCIDGMGWFELDGAKQMVVAGQYFILPRDRAHAYGSDTKNPWTIYWIHFDGLLAGYFAEELDKAHWLGTEKNSRIEMRVMMFEEIFNSLRNGYSRRNLAYSTSCLFHFLGSLKFVGAYRESIRSNADEEGIVSLAIHYMRENIIRKVTVDEMAAFVGYSVSHFISVFHKKTGQAPIHYLTQLRIQQACHQLDFSDMKINQIATMSGYDDPFYFSRTFKKVMGISPQDYRKKAKG